MIFRKYANSYGRKIAHCEACAQKLANGDTVMIDRNMFYCKKCADKLRDERIAKLESKIGCKLKKIKEDSKI
jgi:hypothetical protein